LASPNPYVGAVITDTRGEIVGEGTHTYAGIKHAEILALEQASDRARGGTLYINLEPHAHQSRNPPCTDALIKAGVKRVVASMEDPNPKVSGRGFEQLRAAGVQVEVGLLEAEARRMNEAFARYIRSGTPFITLKSAMTLDGKIAPRPAESSSTDEFRGTWITGPEARAHVQELRLQHDAILTGIGTILADNPLLTDRSGKARRKPLMRVVLDTHLRIPLDSQIVRSAKDDVIVACSLPDHKQLEQLRKRGIRVVVLPCRIDRHPDIHEVVRALGKLEIVSVLIEGGSRINDTFLNADLIDKAFFFRAPIVLGPDAVPFARGRKRTPDELKRLRFYRFGNDIAIEAYVRDPYND